MRLLKSIYKHKGLRKSIAISLLSIAIGLQSIAVISLKATATTTKSVTEKEVVNTYVTIASMTYNDAYETGQKLYESVTSFLDNPNAVSLEKTRAAWKHARKFYQQTEVFRFGTPEVDAWEGRVNSWPLDEGLIDYVDHKTYAVSEENPYTMANIIANPEFKHGGKLINAQTITENTIEALHEVDGIESNVATGYHAIEFLLWGQDLNGFKPGAGARLASDYSLKSCTNKNCDRRRDYLRVATELLVSDLKVMKEGFSESGAIRKSIQSLKPKEAISRMFKGMGSLSYGELAGERIKLGLMLNDPEEEHDCFSDNTHASHYYNTVGIDNVYRGRYVSVNGQVFRGPSLSALVAQENSSENLSMLNLLTYTHVKFRSLYDQGESGVSYDTLLNPGNKEGKKILTDLVDALAKQTKGFEKVIEVLGLGGVAIESSDALK